MTPEAVQQCMVVQVDIPATHMARPYQAGFSHQSPSDVTLEVTVKSDFLVSRVLVELATSVA